MAEYVPYRHKIERKSVVINGSTALQGIQEPYLGFNEQYVRTIALFDAKLQAALHSFVPKLYNLSINNGVSPVDNMADIILLLL